MYQGTKEGAYQQQLQTEQAELQKKNIKSNVVLQPLNYKTSGGQSALDEVMRNQFMENHPLFNNQVVPQSTHKKGHLEKLNH